MVPGAVANGPPCSTTGTLRGEDAVDRRSSPALPPPVGSPPVARPVQPRTFVEGTVYVWGDATGHASLLGVSDRPPTVGVVGRSERSSAVADSIRAAREEALLLRWWEVVALAIGAADL